MFLKNILEIKLHKKSCSKIFAATKLSQQFITAVQILYFLILIVKTINRYILLLCKFFWNIQNRINLFWFDIYFIISLDKIFFRNYIRLSKIVKNHHLYYLYTSWL